MKWSQPVPELPVPDVRAAQEYYRDRLGFEIAWYDASGEIGAVAHGDCALFFRKSEAPITPLAFWMFREDVDAAYADMQALGADIPEPLADMPWGLRQFTVQDQIGHRFYIFHDL